MAITSSTAAQPMRCTWRSATATPPTARTTAIRMWTSPSAPRTPPDASRAATVRRCRHHSLLLEPEQRVRERACRWSPAVAQFARRPRAREVHVLAREAHRFDRNAGAAPGEPGECLRGVGDRQQRRVGQTDARWAAAREAADLHENLAQRHVLTAENVALTDAPALERQQVARGDIIDVHDVEAGVYIGGRPARGGVHDHLSGRRRLDIARPDGG